MDYQTLQAHTAAAPTHLAQRIAIQGVHGAFHEIAARRYLPYQALEIVPADTFDDVVRFTETGLTDAGMMAIENTIAGSLLRNYNLLNDSNLCIKGEVFLRIKQNLMALPGVAITDLKEVHSHPIALQQVEFFFQKYPHIKLIEAHDTALVAQDIQKNQWAHIGAIGSELAADIYDLHILAHSIESYKKNFTRFLHIQPRTAPNTEGGGNLTANKVSMVFTTRHEVGSLHKVLAILAENRCNLTKIQSAPIMDKPWEYLFFVDFTMDDYADYLSAIGALQGYVGDIKILGEYQSGAYFE